ncbi:VOC family protein [Streptomyces phytophilus]|uniref:VOC family protein n=1 Tax=Streptomyces phytophilus TaxID=722715 RepID=UPI0015F11BCE|nr:VOC family protein [Streptomyces phytophilus]
MSFIQYVTIEAADPDAARRFYAAVLDTEDRVRVAESAEPTTGFRGFTMSLVVARPADADATVDSSVAAGATVLKPSKKSLWGYGGVVQAPDGTVWTVASQSKKDTGPATGAVEGIVLQLAVADVAASKEFYAGRGFAVTKSYGRKYVEFADPAGPVAFSLYKRADLAKVAGVPPEGTGSHRLRIAADTAPFTDPDGFEWEAPE